MSSTFRFVGREVDDKLELVGCGAGKSAGFAPLNIFSP
jgi:hypothetical protein